MRSILVALTLSRLRVHSYKCLARGGPCLSLFVSSLAFPMLFPRQAVHEYRRTVRGLNLKKGRKDPPPRVPQQDILGLGEGVLAAHLEVDQGHQREPLEGLLPRFRDDQPQLAHARRGRSFKASCAPDLVVARKGYRREVPSAGHFRLGRGALRRRNPKLLIHMLSERNQHKPHACLAEMLRHGPAAAIRAQALGGVMAALVAASGWACHRVAGKVRPRAVPPSDLHAR